MDLGDLSEPLPEYSSDAASGNLSDYVDSGATFENEVVAGHQCFENGSLMVPLVIDGGNMTLTTAAQVNREINH
jgi:hypothetical protein